MASSLTGERRWGATSTRRSGMTVLGKVAIPKPINLPSQRLENRGLDPNVEIVPKGTLHWGSRPSTSPNAWGTSPPNTTGSSGSPSFLHGQPSSGGSETRPSTGNSEKSLEHVYNSWGSNSRPSSSPGIMAASQASLASMRPHSSEKRPGSSQLSRFADSLPENAVPWGQTVSTQKMPADSSKNDEFNLSSGDFPSLGSERNPPSHAPQEASVEGVVDTWTSDYPMNLSGGPRSMDKWQNEPQPRPSFSNVNMPHNQFDPSWARNPVPNAPEGVWYRGQPDGPYRPTAPHNGYPLEPFAYYGPQLPFRPFSNSQVVPRPGPSGSHGPEPYMLHFLPMRPGAFPGPVPYDVYYGPPHIRFHNQSAHPDPVQFHPPPLEYGAVPSGNEAHTEPTPSGKSQHASYKILSKQHDALDLKDSQDGKKDCEDSSHSSDHHTMFASEEPVGKEHERIDKIKVVDKCSEKVQDSEDFSMQGVKSMVSINKNSTLIEKIECLNAKVRISDKRNSESFSTRERRKLPEFETESYPLKNEDCRGSVQIEKKTVKGSELCASVLDTENLRSQRAKMKELAAQRSRQLQKEEEERIREQKAKALVKLEELNMRTIAEVPNQNRNHNSSDKTAEFQAVAKSDFGISDVTSCSSMSNCHAIFQVIDNKISESSSLSPTEITCETEVNSHLDSVKLVSPICPPKDPTTEIVDSHKDVLHPDSNPVQSRNETKPLLEDGKVGDAMIVVDIATIPSEGSSHLKRTHKGTKDKNKNKNKPNEASFPVTLSEVGQMEGEVSKESERKSLDIHPDPKSSSVQTSKKNFKVHEEQRDALLTERNRDKISGHWKQSSSSRTTKNHGIEAVVWAPVRSMNKNEAKIVEPNQNTNTEMISLDSSYDLKNSVRNKRAEMERYIPKHVAKELPQPGKTQQLDEAMKNVELGSHNIRTVEHLSNKKNKDSKNKTHQSWRQHVGSTTGVQTFKEETHGTIQQPIEHHEPNTVTQTPKEDFISNVPSLRTDKYNNRIPNYGRRQTSKAYGDAGSRQISEETMNVLRDSTSESTESHRNTVLNSERSNDLLNSASHWQPKSQPSRSHDYQGSRNSRGSKISYQSARIETEHPPQDLDKSMPRSKDADPTETHLKQPERHGERNSGYSNKKYTHSRGENTAHNGQFISDEELHRRGLYRQRTKHNYVVYEDRRKQNSRYEYQPTASHNDKSKDKFNDSTSAMDTIDPEHGELKSNNSNQRGHFNRHNRGNFGRE